MRCTGGGIYDSHLIVIKLCQKIDKQMTAFNVKNKNSFGALQRFSSQ
jgi:hypothetical protein